MRLIDKDEIRIKPEYMHDICGVAMIRVEDMARILNNAPTIRPDIIRCKDCIYQTESGSGIKYCEINGDHIGTDYDYCSNVRRRDNGGHNKQTGCKRCG